MIQLITFLQNYKKSEKTYSQKSPILFFIKLNILYGN